LSHYFYLSKKKSFHIIDEITDIVQNCSKIIWTSCQADSEVLWQQPGTSESISQATKRLKELFSFSKKLVQKIHKPYSSDKEYKFHNVTFLRNQEDRISFI
jgi:hypothetical protein